MPPIAETHATLLAHGDQHRRLVIATAAFLTLVDLFATQAIVPTLAQLYRVGPAEMGFAVNACTFGMAAASLGVALFGSRIDPARGIVAALALLSVPTALLAWAPDLGTFAALRVAQGLCMASAFTLALAYLGERSSGAAAAQAFAAYVTGNVASNLVGRLASASIADGLGTDANFLFFALLNLAGAALVRWTARTRDRQASEGGTANIARPGAGRNPSSIGRALAHLRNGSLVASFVAGFGILFAFIGVFTYVNFVLAERLALPRQTLGLVYLVFLPSVLTTPLAGDAAARWGVRRAMLGGLVIAAVGLVFLVLATLPAILLGMTLVAIGTFFAQGVATGFVGRAARTDQAAASGLYLASYFAGGLLGSFVLGRLFEDRGWGALVVGVALALAVAGIASLWMRLDGTPVRSPR